MKNIDNNSRLADFWSQAASDDYISLRTAKAIIVTALSQFNSELGDRAKVIFDNSVRANIIENPEVSTGMMACRPSGITEEDLKKMGMYISDFEERFTPNFKQQDNAKNFSIIDFEYDGSTESVVYLAHELGHAIADDIQIEAGKSFRDFSLDELEQQAYLVQSIFSHYTKQSSPESLVASGQQSGDELGISWDRAQQYSNAGITLSEGLAIGFDQRGTFLITALGGDSSRKPLSNLKPIHEGTDLER